MNVEELPMIGSMVANAEILLNLGNVLAQTADNATEDELTQEAIGAIRQVALDCHSLSDKLLEASCLCAQPAVPVPTQPEAKAATRGTRLAFGRKGGGTPPPKAG